MSAEKYSPLPWHFERIGNDIEIWARPSIGQLSVAWIHIGHDHTSGELEACIADARLIVRAVNSHDALREALEAHHKWSLTHMEGYSDHGDEAVAYRATIAALERSSK